MQTALETTYRAQLTPDGDYFIIQVFGEKYEIMIYTTKDGESTEGQTCYLSMSHNICRYFVNHFDKCNLVYDFLSRRHTWW